MKILLWLIITLGLARNLYRLIKGPRFSVVLSLGFWLALAAASLTGAPVFRILAVGLLIAGFFLKFQSSSNDKNLSSPGDEGPTLDVEGIEIPDEMPGESSDDPEEFIRAIPENADNCAIHAKILNERTLDFSPESLETVDKLISKHWGDEPPALLDHMTVIFGSYVGETLRRNLGGQWEHTEENGYTLSQIGGQDIKAYPFGKTHRRFTQGEGDSVAFFYRALEQTLKKDSLNDDQIT